MQTSRTPFAQHACPAHRLHSGITTLDVLVVTGTISLLIGLLAPAVQSARERARQTSCTNNLRQIGIACEAHLVAQRRYPAYLRSDGDISGHARLLPYLDQSPLYNRIALDTRGAAVGEPPVCSGAQEFLTTPLSVFVCPSDAVPVGGNSYRACFGTTLGIHATWAPGRPRPPALSAESLWGAFTGARRDADMRDGLSQTAFFSERLVGDGTATRYTPSRDIASTDQTIYYFSHWQRRRLRLDIPARFGS